LKDFYFVCVFGPCCLDNFLLNFTQPAIGI
jgi:hypothetical protein